MTKAARFAAAATWALLAGAPALAQLRSDPVVWECKVERRIDSGKTTMYDQSMRQRAELRLIFVADVPHNRGCLLDAGQKAKEICAVMFTGAAENGGMLRLDMTDDHQVLDLVNIFPSTGQFMRIHGATQWMGDLGDCSRSEGRKVKLP